MNEHNRKVVLFSLATLSHAARGLPTSASFPGVHALYEGGKVKKGETVDFDMEIKHFRWQTTLDLFPILSCNTSLSSFIYTRGPCKESSSPAPRPTVSSCKTKPAPRLHHSSEELNV